ncbi:LysE family transporter [Aurantimonas sp. A2-1-M11]|uniref:LysE family translocator n=1 Tax=Aurantimonas sp. A2-1-M11 TaxID=3113712 RepID=UPI002F9400DC
MSFAAYLPAMLAFFVVAASPRPATLAVSTTAMARGARPDAILGIGLAVGLGAWGVVAAAGLGALLVQSTTALTVLRWVGGAYLFYLAWQSARSAIAPAGPNETAGPVSGSRLIARGLLLNLSNPKAVLAWISVLALGVGMDGNGADLAITTGMCAVISLLIYLVYAAAFSQPPVRAGYRHAQRAIEGMAAVFFAYSGARLVLTRTETP